MSGDVEFSKKWAVIEQFRPKLIREFGKEPRVVYPPPKPKEEQLSALEPSYRDIAASQIAKQDPTLELTDEPGYLAVSDDEFQEHAYAIRAVFNVRPAAGVNNPVRSRE